MDLPESLVLERYRLALERQNYFVRMARDAFGRFGTTAAVVTLVGVALIAARDSFGLDQAMMPDLLDLLACVVTFLAVICWVQIGVAILGRRRYRRLEQEIDASITERRGTQWMVEATYALVVAVAVFVTWEIASEFGQEILRTPSAAASTLNHTMKLP